MSRQINYHLFTFLITFCIELTTMIHWTQLNMKQVLAACIDKKACPFPPKGIGYFVLVPIPSMLALELSLSCVQDISCTSGFCVWPLFCCAVLCVLSSFQSSWWGRDNWLLYLNCLPGISGLWLFLTVTLVDLQYVIVVFPEHTIVLAYLFGTKFTWIKHCAW